MASRYNRSGTGISINGSYGFGGSFGDNGGTLNVSNNGRERTSGGRYSPWSTLDNFHGNFNDNFPVNGINPFSIGSNLNSNGLMQIMNAMANGFNMNPAQEQIIQMSCGELRAHHAGMRVELTGRLIKKRVNRFVELRDRNGGATQMVVLDEKYPRIFRRIQNMPEHTVLTVIGLVTKRPQHSCNQTMPTGEIEVEIQDIVGIEFNSSSKRAGDKRSYSTMSQQNYTGITSTEYKMAKSQNILKFFENRIMTCNDVRRKDVGKDISLVGWITTPKNNKFMQLKDGHGQIQIVITDQDILKTCLDATESTVIQVTGKVLARPRASINMKYETGEVEVVVDSVRILDPEQPYDGPIKTKNKVQKISIDDLNKQDGEELSINDVCDETKNVISKKDGCEVCLTNANKVIKIADLNKFTNRTHTCNELTGENVGEKVIIYGWLEYQRMGKFLIIRDSYGQTQVILKDKVKEDLEKKANKGLLSLESILKIEGTVIPRPTATANANMKTGQIEIEAQKVDILNPASKNLPFVVRKFNRASENMRLAHRYIDLRFSDMQRNLRMRSQVLMRMREYLINYLGFVEVETPTLFRRTPGGAQEFIVPTRKPGYFYSLVQSPQQFKQMLMAGAIDRYFQVARCYRDEATRPDRQPEFTQLDIELSFTSRDSIIELVEELLRYSWPKELTKIQTPFHRLTYNEAMENYGSDKPDTRFGFLLQNVTEIISQNKALKNKFSNLGSYGIVVHGSESYWTGTMREHFEDVKKNFGGILFVRKFNEYKDILDRLTNLFSADVAQKLIEHFELEENDLLILAIGEQIPTRNLMGTIRLQYQKFLLENNKSSKYTENAFVWIVDYPMFEKDAEIDGKINSVHHPFTAPHPEDSESFARGENLLEIRSLAYDLVVNGQEIGGGSMRIHDSDLQKKVLEMYLNISYKELSHLLDALQSGCPPHGGIALGLDRLLAIMCNAESIRDVIAFPKSLNGRDPLSSAPVHITSQDKALYHLAITNDGKVVDNSEIINLTDCDEDSDGKEENTNQFLDSSARSLQEEHLKQEVDLVDSIIEK